MRIGTLNLTADGPAAVRDTVRDAGRRGLDAVWTNQMPGSWDPLALLAAAEPGTGPAELGTAVTLTGLRHPVALATQALTTQAALDGRLTLGVGPGHAPYLSGELGLPFDAPAARTPEYLEVLVPLLRGERVTHRGRFLEVDTRLALPRPVPAPRLLLSALGPRMLELAGELTDGTVVTWVRPEFVRDHLRPALPDTARVVVSVTVGVTADPDRFLETVAQDFAPVRTLPSYRALLDRGGLRGPEETVVAGSEEHVARALARFGDAGATDLVVVDLAPEGRSALDVAVTLSSSRVTT
ncbi:LLM class flavin-dependent oxidoreductase [Pseudonocardia tropica]|uniref:LLM class flavin-dependent oxidoreductase n=1 Tax=Pseudonocardia tropica TaxID=681289 RepID=A0ABV1JRY6_9PSEU